MLKKLIFTTLLASTFLPLALRAAAPGKSALPKDEIGIEQDLDEDDGSITITPAKNDGPLSPEPTIPAAQEPAPSYQPTKAYQGGVPDEARPSASVGEKTFDWSKHQNETEVAHPFAEKGLIRISKDKTYLYKVEESPQDRAADMHIGSFNPIHLSNPDQVGKRGATFEENYDQTSNPAVLFNYEWQMWRSAIGKFGVRIGSGIFVAQGNGHFVGDVNAAKTPREVFTFGLLPNALGVVYRMQMWHRQLIVPYAEGGGNLFTFAEFRDDNKSPKFGGSLGVYGVAGVALNLTYFDYLARIQLDREYGINACYLTIEYRTLVAVTKRYDMTSDFVNAGFLMEY